MKYLLALLLLPFVVGVWYDHCGTHDNEQVWLNQVVQHLSLLHESCTDPDTREVLAYTIRRYDKIGGFDVMILPCLTGYIGCNCPYCPGLTLDPDVMQMPISIGAMLLLHEAMHDYFPYLHPFVDERMQEVGCL